jgi:DNA processing protein
MRKDLLHGLALCNIPGIGPVWAKKLLQHFGDASAIFKASLHDLARIEGLGETRAKAITGFVAFDQMEKELAFIEKYGVKCLFFTDQDYPQRLSCVREAPAILFYMGSADLNSRRIISIVGTRSPTAYGRQATERLVAGLSPFGPLIVSGLADGIDGIAHRAAITHSLPSVGVLGHGLDQIYPSEHAPLAREMIRQGGGLLTPFTPHSKSAPYHFPLRNRIVASMSDALVVAETRPDGGSMLTVGNAHTYGKKIFAFPGRLTDQRSAGCNQLIQQGVARLLVDGSQLATALGWDATKASRGRQTSLFPPPSEQHLAADEKTLLHLLKNEEKVSIDRLAAQTQLNSSAISVALLNLELQGWIVSLPGKMYRLAA